MRTILACLLALVLTAPLVAGDTITVKTLTFDDITKRSGTYLFPPAQRYEKVLMEYTLKCDPRTTQDAYPCGEWDYLTYTFITDSTGEFDSTRLTRTNYVVGGTTPDTFPYTTTATTVGTRLTQRYVVRTDTASVAIRQLTTGTTPVSGPLSATPWHGQYLLKASDLQAKGLTAGPITGLRLNVATASGTRSAFMIRMRSTTRTSIGPAFEQGAMTTCFERDTTFAVGVADLWFTSAFTWDGTSNIIVDISHNGGSGAAGTVNGAAITAGTGVQFSGPPRAYRVAPGDRMTLPTAVGSSLSSEVTVMFWAYGDPVRMPKQNNVFEAYDAQGRRIMNVHLPWDNKRVYWDCGYTPDGGAYDRIEKDIPDSLFEGRWNHYAFVKNSTTGIMQIYVNGELFHEGNGKSRVMNGIARFHFMTGDNSTWEGMIKEIAVCNKALSQSAVRTAMNTNALGAAGLQAYYRCNDADPLIATDESGKNNHASVFGVPTRELIAGVDQTIGGEAATLVPNFGLEQGSFTQSTSSTSVLRTTPGKQWAVILYEKPAEPRVYPIGDSNDPGQATDTILVWQAGWQYIRNGLGVVVDSTFITPTATLTKQTKVYYSPIAVFEIGRYITPYGIGLDLGPNGFKWVYDVTDYAPLLRGNVTLSAGNQQELIDLTFKFIKGTPPRDVKQITQIYRQGGYAYSQIVTDQALPPVDVRLEPDVASVRVRTRTSGHDFSNSTNCAEFCQRLHHLKVNGQKKFEWLLWKECGDNPVYPQGGTWLIDRTGWCPGAPVDEQWHEVTPYVTLNAVNKFDYGVESDSVNGLYGRWDHATQLFGYGPTNHTLDAAVVDVMRPNSYELYGRINPICGMPMVIIQNTGSTELTSVKLVYSAGGSPSSTYTWSGRLAFLQMDTVELPSPVWPATEGLHTFSVRVQEPNGGSDQYADNNERTTSFVAPPSYYSDVTIALRTNNFADEQYEWYLKRLDNDSIIDSGKNLRSNFTYSTTYDLKDGCYEYLLENKLGYGLDFWFLRDQLGTGSLQFTSKGLILKTFEPDFGNRQWIQFTAGSKPTIASDVDTLRFPTIKPNEAVEEEAFFFAANDKPITVDGVTVFNLKNHFTLVSATPDPRVAPVTLQPGDSMRVVVRFSREDEGNSAGFLRVTSNDIRQPTKQVRLLGAASLTSDVFDERSLQQIEVGVVPNPATLDADVVVVTPDALAGEVVTVTVRDLFGRSIAVLFTGTLAAGEQRFTLPTAIAAGRYAVALEHDGALVTSPFTVVR